MSINMAWAALKSAVGVSPAATVTASAKALQQASSGFLENMVAVKPHVPLIRFRAGTSPDAAPVAPVPGVSETVTVSSSSSPPSVYEWYELPTKYRKDGISDTELECINMGGAGVQWQ